jgi:hypothetical protein
MTHRAGVGAHDVRGVGAHNCDREGVCAGTAGSSAGLDGCRPEHSRMRVEWVHRLMVILSSKAKLYIGRQRTCT